MELPDRMVKHSEIIISHYDIIVWSDSEANAENSFVESIDCAPARPAKSVRALLKFFVVCRKLREPRSG